ncbi:hypothetical protein SLEP1_g47887 [Rubroshorea leprosula]|uniref:Uncharacterized protein n=1 Tax=Rubroshorea leprosula TaxID=152421 RepID=A0AAV5LTZ3_9ROSI|nr:hypothetical protein SLEP1_g47887 [Rubroshorea leprosula]
MFSDFPSSIPVTFLQFLPGSQRYRHPSVTIQIPVSFPALCLGNRGLGEARRIRPLCCPSSVFSWSYNVEDEISVDL